MVLKIAHMGASGYAPENTLEALRKALELKVDVVEFDVHHTRDGRIIVMHDHNLKRTTDCLGHVHEFPLEEIRKCHEPNGEPVPTLQEAINVLKNKCIIKIDVKDKGSVSRIIKVIKENHIEGSVIITSELPLVLEKAKELDSSIRLEAGGFKKEPIEDIIREAKRVKADIIGPHYSITTKKLVDEAHKNRLEVHVWTVDDKKTIERMKKIGVDGITSNFPDRI